MFGTNEEMNRWEGSHQFDIDKSNGFSDFHGKH